MALPLEPDTTDEMFPDTLVPPFIDAPEVHDLAFTLIEQWDEFRALREAIDSQVHPLSVAYVFDTKKIADDEDLTIHGVVKPTKASPLWRHLSGHGVVIAFRQAVWTAIDDPKRRAFLHHALSHIDVLGGKVAFRDHPAEAFPWTFRRYGPLSIGEQMLSRAAALWAEDHPVEPTPLRSVADKVMDAVADAAERGELDDPETGTTVTVSRPGRETKRDKLAEATAHRLGTSTTKPRGSAQAAARPAGITPDDRIGKLECQGANHVPGHTPGCPSYVVS